MGELIFNVFILLVFAPYNVIAGGSVCAGLLCSNGQCVSRSSFCNGNCDCGDCSDEKLQTCPSFDGPQRDSNGSSLGSGAIIGIVVAAICILLLLIGILIIFLICRIRREALKNLRTRRGQLDLTAPGCVLPVDIPVEALARVPPPRYTPRADNDLTGEFSINVLPPPYFAPGTSAITEFSCSYEAPPPKYQSLNDLSKTTEVNQKKGGACESVDLRQTTITGFSDEPSMTSSRSSDLGFNSQQPSATSVRVGGQSEVSRCPMGSALGDSTDWRSRGSSSSSSTHFSTSNRSQSLSNIHSGSVDIPRCEIQKKSEGGRNECSKNSAIPSRSFPSLYGIQRKGCNLESRISNEETPIANRKQKQGKYRKKSNHEKSPTHDSSSISGEGIPDSSTISVPQLQATSSGNGLSTRRCISRSLPQLVILQEESKPWSGIGSCEV